MMRTAVRYAALKARAKLDLQALHHVRERLLSQRTGVINQIPRLPAGARHSYPPGLARCVPSCRALSHDRQADATHGAQSSRTSPATGASLMNASKP